MNKGVYTKLVKQLSEGSRDAFTQLYMIYSDQIYGFALKLTKSSVEAEDILQETFMRLWDNRSRISPEMSFKSYLFQISYHLAIDSFRKQIESVDFESFLNSDYYQKSVENSIEQELSIDDYKRLVAESLSRLTPRQQDIYRLSREEGFSSKEIGEKLGISEKTVNNQLSIILLGLKADLLLFLMIYVF